MERELLVGLTRGSGAAAELWCTPLQSLAPWRRTYSRDDAAKRSVLPSVSDCGAPCTAACYHQALLYAKACALSMSVLAYVLVPEAPIAVSGIDSLDWRQQPEAD